MLREGMMPGRELRCALCFVLAPLLFGAAELTVAWFETPGQAIRGQLTAVAAEARLELGRSAPEVLSAVQDRLVGMDATVDVSPWPQLLVTLRSIDRDTCIEAQSTAGRMEGMVVVELESQRLPQDCREQNDMRWRIMP